jgi:hypothetical protein
MRKNIKEFKCELNTYINTKKIKKELIEYVLDPNRLLRLCKLYGLIFNDINDIY